MPKAYSYLRFSTPEQMKGDSFRRQTEMAERYATQHCLDLDDRLTFRDLGVSGFRGKNFEAGELGAFQEAVHKGLVERGSYLLVESLDRVSRQTARRAARVLESICDAGIVVVTLSDGKEYTSESLDNDPISFLMSILIFMRANEESATKSRRISAVWDAKRKRASERPMTSMAPAWLSLDKESGEWTVDRTKASVVKRIYRDSAKGVGQHAIAASLNEERVPVFGRGKRKGMYWHRSYIVKLLGTPAVIGTMVPHSVSYNEGKRHNTPSKPIENYFPAIVDRDLYERVQTMRRAANSPLRGRHAATGEVRNIFGGLLVCAKCGGRVTRVTKGSGPKGGKERLVCAKAKQGAGCVYRTTPYRDVEEALLRHASELIGTAPAGDDGAVDDELEQVEGNLLGVDTAIENVLERIERGDKSASLSERLRDLEAEREELREQEADLYERKASVSGPLVQAKLKDLRDALRAVPLKRAETNALMRQVFGSITLNHETGTLDYAWQHGGETRLIFAWPEGQRRRRKAVKAK